VAYQAGTRHGAVSGGAVRHGAEGGGDTISLGRPPGPLHPHLHLHLHRQTPMLHSTSLWLTIHPSALS